MSLLAGHAILGADYQRGWAAGLAYAQAPEADLPPRAQPRRAEKEELLWALLVRTPLRDEAEAVAAMAEESREMSALLPGVFVRAYEEGFADGLRQHVGAEVARLYRAPARWKALLRQSTQEELARMLRLLPRCRNWTEFFTRLA